MCADIFLGLLAILFPPLPVWVKRGICTADSFINILLCTLGYIPGLIHAWYIIARFPEDEDGYYREGSPQDHNEDGRVTYVFVHQQPQAPPGVMNYGTTAAAPASSPNGGGVSSSSPSAPPPRHHAHENGGEGGSNGAQPPPTYAEAIKGDFKVQTQD